MGNVMHGMGKGGHCTSRQKALPVVGFGMMEWQLTIDLQERERENEALKK
jgi:hypothetical protein